MTDTNTKLQTLVNTIMTLRGDRGCPWDRKQTCSTMIRYLRDECEELVAAISNNDPENICEETGDVLYILIMLAEINRSQGLFDFNDVIETVNAKLIRRHPHVFGGQTYENEEALYAQWQAIKAKEKK